MIYFKNKNKNKIYQKKIFFKNKKNDFFKLKK